LLPRKECDAVKSVPPKVSIKPEYGEIPGAESFVAETSADHELGCVNLNIIITAIESQVPAEKNRKRWKDRRERRAPSRLAMGWPPEEDQQQNSGKSISSTRGPNATRQKGTPWVGRGSGVWRPERLRVRGNRASLVKMEKRREDPCAIGEECTLLDCKF